MSTPATHPDIAELIQVGRSAVDRGLVLATGGNLSVALPDRSGFLITRAAAYLDRLEHHDFVTVSMDGTVLDPPAEPSSEWRLHQHAYGARPDATVLLHLHPQHAVLLDALGHEIRMLTLDHHSYVRSVSSVGFYPNGSVELAEAAAAAAREHDCVVLRHHGCSVLADNVAMAYRRALNLEEAAVATYRALLLGDSTTCFPDGVGSEVVHGS